VHALDRPTVYSWTHALPHVRAGDLATERDAFGLFASQPSAQAITVAATALVAARVGLGEAGRGEVIAPFIAVGPTGPAERARHRNTRHTPSGDRLLRRAPRAASPTRRLGNS
jgi:hypothetical protein